LTVATEELVDSASIAAASTKRKSLWLVALRNPSVIIGGTILLFMLATAPRSSAWPCSAPIASAATSTAG
jgi:hypothetical protein